MFVVHCGRAATAAAVEFSAQGWRQRRWWNQGVLIYQWASGRTERSQEVLPYGFPWRGRGRGEGKSSQVHLLQVGGESKIKISCRRLLTGQRWTHSTGAGLHGCAGICWGLEGACRLRLHRPFFCGICTCWAFLLVVFIFFIIFLPVGDDGCQGVAFSSVQVLSFLASVITCWLISRKAQKKNQKNLETFPLRLQESCELSLDH